MHEQLDRELITTSILVITIVLVYLYQTALDSRCRSNMVFVEGRLRYIAVAAKTKASFQTPA
jgi:hypothetical protein